MRCSTRTPAAWIRALGRRADPMPGTANVASFLFAATLVVLVPGPATLYVAGQAHRSAGSAGRAMAGIIVGDLVLITLSGLGFSALVTRWPVMLLVLQLGGALYVTFLRS